MDLLEEKKWLDICPWLHLNDEKFQTRKLKEISSLEILQKSKISQAKDRLISDGYMILENKWLNWCVEIKALAKGVKQLVKHNIPPTFIAVYDEVWLLQEQISRVMEIITGNKPVMDTLCFYVDPTVADGGFSMHRDRTEDDWKNYRNSRKGEYDQVKDTFRSDGTALYSTLWIALTDATCDNSCLYFLPRNADKGYLTDELPKEVTGKEIDDRKMSASVKFVFDDQDTFHHIRAAPIPAGAATIHTHRTLHWGGRVRENYAGEPRISLSFSFSDPDFEPPYTSLKHPAFPCLRIRVSLACGQIINYSSLSSKDRNGWLTVGGNIHSSTKPTSAEVNKKARIERKLELKDLYRIFKNNSKYFDASYVAEITSKYVAISSSYVDDSDDSDLDNVLEAMIDAEANAGEKLFHDDYDALNRS